MSRHELVGVHPTALRLDALEPWRDRGVVRPRHAELVRPIEIAAQREVGDRQPAAGGESLRGEMLVEDPERALHATAQELGHRRLAGLRELDEVAQRGDIARELVVVPQDPPQDLAPLLVTRPAELLERGREVVENHAQLGELPPAVLEDRYLAHLVHLFAVLGRARLTVEEIDPARLPLGTAEVQHERRFVGVPRLREAVEGVLGHGRMLTAVAWPEVAGIDPLSDPWILREWVQAAAGLRSRT